MNSVVIVESPAKAKTINKYLGKDYLVIASYGHIRDLPSKEGSVKPDEDFEMLYEISPKSEKHVKDITKAVQDADEIMLATDPDREGEAISWHIVEALKKKKALKKQKISRVVFNEITKKAVTDAIKNPRDIDMDLVNAQQARRALDYLVGFTLSPVLWRKLPGSKSAGRVQSVALRLIAEREGEIEQFVKQEYWSIKSELFTNNKQKLIASLVNLEGKKLDKFYLKNEAQVKAIVEQLKNKSYAVKDIEKKQQSRNPSPPFTTSSLQQEASRKLGFSAKHTMSVAQKLYEGVDIAGQTIGLITYMRTDSVNLSEDSISATRDLIAKRFGKDYVPSAARYYKSKAKNAQEAHEAIRPTDVALTPEEAKPYLQGDQFALYELIWKRMVACQMENVVLDMVAINIETTDKYATFRVVGSTIKFDGFYKLYKEGIDDEDDEEHKVLPKVEEGEKLDCKNIMPAQHFTEPPPRFGEASLVKKLEELGIGRPSTYASIISVLQEREYVRLEKKRFIPEERGRLVTSFLVNFFKKYVEYDFTADLENELDLVADGKLNYKKLLKDFWNNFNDNIQNVKKIDIVEILDAINKDLEKHFFGDDPNNRNCPSCSDGKLSIRLGRYGAFIACSSYPSCNYTKQIDDSGNSEGEEGEGEKNEEFEDKLIGEDPESGKEIYLKKGPYGYYVQLGEQIKKSKEKVKRASIPAHIQPLEVTLDQAVALLSLPRTVGIHPETRKEIQANYGRFGPYLLHDTKYTSIPVEDDVLTIGINRAVSVIADAAAGKKGGKASTSSVIKNVGEHPANGKEIAVYSGRFGPYIKFDGSNYKLPKNVKPESLSLEEAVGIIGDVGGADAKPKKATRKKKEE